MSKHNKNKKTSTRSISTSLWNVKVSDSVSVSSSSRSSNSRSSAISHSVTTTNSRCLLIGTICIALIAVYVTTVNTRSGYLLFLSDDNPSILSVPCTNDNLANVLLDIEDARLRLIGHNQDELLGIPGFHVLCIKEEFNNNAYIDDDVLNIRLFANGLNATQYNGSSAVSFVVPKSFDLIRDDLESRLRLTPDLDRLRENRQAWALYTPSGRLIYGASDVGVDEINILNQILSSEMVFLFTGGAFVWPTVRVGFEREIDVSSIISYRYDHNGYNKLLFSNYDLFGRDKVGSARRVILETLSITPAVFAVKNFLTADECDFVRDKAEPLMVKSGVSHNDQDKNSPATKWRTSSSAFLSAKRSRNDDKMHDIDRRVASLTRVPRNHHEQVQVLRYNYLEKYNAHHDYFDNALYRTSEQTQRLIQGGKRNRLATVFWYLSDVREGAGGETIFPRVNRGRNPRDMADCSVGLRVRPEKGKVIIFYSMHPNGNIDPFSLHGACPILGESETKWAANKWIWNANMGFVKF